MAQIHYFKTDKAVGGRQFVAHKVFINGAVSKFSVWFCDANGGTLVDAERRDRANRAVSVRQGTAIWDELAKQVPLLIAAYDRENA